MLQDISFTHQVVFKFIVYGRRIRNCKHTNNIFQLQFHFLVKLLNEVKDVQIKPKELQYYKSKLRWCSKWIQQDYSMNSGQGQKIVLLWRFTA